MKKILSLCFLGILIASNAHARRVEQYPNITGNVLTLFKADRIISAKKDNIDANNAYLFIEPQFSFNINEAWSIKTDWRLQPNNVLTTRDQTNPERYRTFLQSNRGFNFQDMGLLIEQLKLDFQNDDFRFYAGKFDPTFGTAWSKAKRMGIFTSDFTEDYNLREKIGGGMTVFLENSKFSANTFFNDTTAMSRSAIHDRGRAQRLDGLSGNTGTFSSYSLSLEGSNVLGLENWFYNVGYRSLGVDKLPNRSRETGYVLQSEYLYNLTNRISLIPFIEIVKFKNFSGINGRDALYTTSAVIAKYSNWTASISNLTRNINMVSGYPTASGRQLQFSAGYKFTNNLTLDVTRANIVENGRKAALIGFAVSYLYNF